MTLNRTQWDELLVSPDADQRLEDLQVQGVIRSVFPVLQSLVGFGGGDTGHKDLWAHTKRVVIQTIPQVIPRWCALFHDIGKPQAFLRIDGEVTFRHHEAVSAKLFRQVARETKLFTADETAEISFVINYLGHVEAYEPEWTDSAVRRLDRELGQHLDTLFAVARADCTTKHADKRRRQLQATYDLKRRVLALRAQDAVPPALPSGLGDVLMARLGLRPGKELGQLLAGLRARVEAGELPRNAEAGVYLDALKPPV